MSVSRGGVGIVGFGGFLYAVGGNDGIASLQSVERYNPHTNKWSPVAPMNRRRAGNLRDILLHTVPYMYSTCCSLLLMCSALWEFVVFFSTAIK